MEKCDGQTGYRVERRYGIGSDYVLEQEGGNVRITNGELYDANKTVDLNEDDSLAVLRILAELHGYELTKSQE